VCHLEQEVLVLAMASGDHKAVLDTCLHYGTQDQSLWVSALTHFAARAGQRDAAPGEAEHVAEYLQTALGHVLRLGVLSPVNALQLLATNKHNTLEAVRPFLAQLLTEQTE
jgi:hypothetical protein